MKLICKSEIRMSKKGILSMSNHNKMSQNPLTKRMSKSLDLKKARRKMNKRNKLNAFIEVSKRNEEDRQKRSSHNSVSNPDSISNEVAAEGPEHKRLKKDVQYPLNGQEKSTEAPQVFGELTDDQKKLVKKLLEQRLKKRLIKSQSYTNDSKDEKEGIKRERKFVLDTEVQFKDMDVGISNYLNSGFIDAEHDCQETNSNKMSSDKGNKSDLKHYNFKLNDKITKRPNTPKEGESSSEVSASRDDSPLIVHNLEEDFERELEIKAERSNLTAWNVKNMIKAVITNSEVMKMVDYSLDKSDEKPVYELKLTRAKTKELKGLDHSALWTIPAVPPPKKSEIEVLITQDLPEDSSDEEYNPQDEMSDEESKASEGILDDSVLEEGALEDGVDLDLSTKMAPNEEINDTDENIGQRTRSKLSLSETPLEAIEQAFIPPDITTDMYDTDCDNVDWLNFLKEFMQPLDSNVPEVVDDDNDPEYNVMIDEEHEDADKEELREDRAVKVTKKELNDLMSELAEYTEMLSDDEEEDIPPANKEKDIEIKDNIEKTSDPPKTNSSMELFTEAQILLLNQQLQQHVQLLLQSYLLLCGNTCIDINYSVECRKRLQELDNFRKMREISFFNVLNLDSSVKLINEWTTFVMDPVNNEKIERFMKGELEKVESLKVTKVRYRPKLPEELMKLCLKSDAFLYPLFLPPGGFSDFTLSMPCKFIPSEDQLIAMGLEQFSKFLERDLGRREEFVEVVNYVKQYLVPVKSEEQILLHIKKLLKDSKFNPVKVLFTTQEAPPVKHFVVAHASLNLLSDNPSEYFPDSWLSCL